MGLNLATIRQAPLQWQPSGPRAKTYVASMTLAAANTYIIGLRNAVYQASDREPLAQFVTIDNVANNQYVTINVGAYSFSVPPFMRDDFMLPVQLDTLSISVGSAGTVNVYFSEEKLSNQVSNNLLVQSTAVKTLLFPFTNITVSTAQATTDTNTSVNFAPTVADISYTLLAPVTAGNGWLQYVYNLGSKNVLITPPIGVTINGIWTNASPLTLKPGQAGTIQCDGLNWYFELADATGIAKTFSDLANAGGALINDGAGNLSWGASGGWTLLGSNTVVGGVNTSDFIGIPAGTYRQFAYECDNLTGSNATAILQAAISINNGASYGSNVDLTTNTGPTVNGFGLFSCVSMSRALAKRVFPYHNASSVAGASDGKQISPPASASGAINAVRFTWNGGNWTAGGIINLWGIK